MGQMGGLIGFSQCLCCILAHCQQLGSEAATPRVRKAGSSAGFTSLCAGMALGLAVSLSSMGAVHAEESRAALLGSSTWANSYVKRGEFHPDKGKPSKFSTRGFPYYVNSNYVNRAVCFLAQWQSRIFHVHQLSQKGVDKHSVLVFDVRNSFLEVSLRQMFLEERILQWLALRAKDPI